MHVKGVQLKPHKGSMGQGCVFTLVCHSVHGGRGLASQHASQVTRPGGSASGGRGSASREEGGLHPDGRGGLHLGRRGFASGGKGGSASRGEMGLHPWGLHQRVYISGGGWADPPRSAYRGRESAWGGGEDPPPRDTWYTKGYDQQASGTYPTGMHSSPFTSSFMFCFSFSTRKVATAECILF